MTAASVVVLVIERIAEPLRSPTYWCSMEAILNGWGNADRNLLLLPTVVVRQDTVHVGMLSGTPLPRERETAFTPPINPPSGAS